MCTAHTRNCACCRPAARREAYADDRDAFLRARQIRDTIRGDAAARQIAKAARLASEAVQRAHGATSIDRGLVNADVEAALAAAGVIVPVRRGYADRVRLDDDVPTPHPTLGSPDLDLIAAADRDAATGAAFLAALEDRSPILAQIWRIGGLADFDEAFAAEMGAVTSLPAVFDLASMEEVRALFPDGLFNVPVPQPPTGVGGFISATVRPVPSSTGQPRPWNPVQGLLLRWTSTGIEVTARVKRLRRTFRDAVAAFWLDVFEHLRRERASFVQQV